MFSLLTEPACLGSNIKSLNLIFLNSHWLTLEGIVNDIGRFDNELSIYTTCYPSNKLKYFKFGAADR